MNVPTIVWFLLAAVNLVSFALMGYDKHQARHGGGRIPERTLFLFAFFGGALGIFLGMRAFRHKTQHKRFVYGVPALLAWNLAVVLWALMN